MELYLHSPISFHGIMFIHMLVTTKFHGVTSQKAADSVIDPTSLLFLFLLFWHDRNGEDCNLGFTFVSVYIYTYQCELVLSGKLQLQCILVNTWSITLYNVQAYFLA